MFHFDGDFDGRLFPGRRNAISGAQTSNGSTMPEKKSKTPVYLIDTSSPFYRPLGRRVIICLAAIGWAALEGWHREPFWSLISLACAIYCVYVLFWTYKEPPTPTAEKAAEVDDARDREADAGDSDSAAR